MTDQKQPGTNTLTGVSAAPLAKTSNGKSKTRSIIKAFAIAATFAIGSTALYQAGTIDNDIEFTVTDKEETTYDCGKDDAGYTKVCHDYLITTEDADGNVEVFENTDALFHEKFHPDTIQGQLKEGCSFKASVYGLRMDWANEHRNIRSVKQVSCPETSADAEIPTNADTSPTTLQGLLDTQKPKVEKKGWEIKSTRPDAVSEPPEAEKKGWEIKSTRPAGEEASTNTDNTLQNVQPPKPAKKAFVIKSTR